VNGGRTGRPTDGGLDECTRLDDLDGAADVPGVATSPAGSGGHLAARAWVGRNVLERRRLFGRSIQQRLVTQMYFPGDDLHLQDPIYNSIRDERARLRLVARYDHQLSIPEFALAYRFDIVLDGADATMWED
jgi:hypothetical protein